MYNNLIQVRCRKRIRTWGSDGYALITMEDIDKRSFV
jgi:hypothetical protein